MWQLAWFLVVGELTAVGDVVPLDDVEQMGEIVGTASF